MTPQERLHEFLEDAMKSLGHEAAVFFGQDQRRAADQRPPVCVYTYDGDDSLMTDDDDAVLDEVFSVQVSSRTDTAESDRADLVRRIIERGRRSDEVRIVAGEAGRDDDLEMSLQLLEVSVAPYDSEDSLIPAREELLWGPGEAPLDWGGTHLSW